MVALYLIYDTTDNPTQIVCRITRNTMSSILEIKKCWKMFPGRYFCQIFLWNFLKFKAYGNKLTNIPCLDGENWSLYQWNSVTFMQTNHEQFQQESGYALAKSWWPFLLEFWRTLCCFSFSSCVKFLLFLFFCFTCRSSLTWSILLIPFDLNIFLHIRIGPLIKHMPNQKKKKEKN